MAKKPKENKELITPTTWMEDYVVGMTKAISASLNEQVSVLGAEGTRMAAMHLISALVGNILYTDLTVEHTKKPKPPVNKSLDRIGETKELLQNAMAAGFENAMYKFTGHPIDYYCLVKPVPDAPSGTMN